MVASPFCGQICNSCVGEEDSSRHHRYETLMYFEYAARILLTFGNATARQ